MPRSPLALLLTTLLANLLTPALAQDLSVPRSFYGFGDPTALAVNAAETRAYVGEGAAVSILDLAVLGNPMPASAVLARIPVDASVVALTLDETNQRLLVAGGSYGVLDVALGGASFPVTVRDDPGDKVCFEIALTPSHVLAVFGAVNASELRIYDRATLSLVSTTSLGTGTAFAIALEGTFAYVAMGIGGLVRVDFSVPATPVVQPGPVFPVSVFGEPARARDVAVDSGRLYAAVDGYGLLAVRTTVPWGPGMAMSVTPLTGPAPGGTATLYAHHVAARGGIIAVGANVVAGREADGGPFTSYGPMNYSLAVGGVVTPAPLAAMDALFLFQQGTTGLVQLQREDLAGAWRELILRPTRLWEVHLGLGFVARTAAVPVSVLATYRPVGNAPAEALVSLRDPDVILSGQDSAGTVYSGLLDISDPDHIAPIPGTASNGGLGLWFDAHWPDANPTREWFVGNGNDTFRLHRFDASQPALGHHWELPSPDDPPAGFNNGRNYFLSWLDGDLLLLTRAGTRWGLVGYSKSAIVAEAAIRPPGSTLTTAPLWQLETHFAGELDQGQTWRCRTFSLPSGQRIAAIAAGFHTQAGSNASRPQIVLYDVSAGTTAVPTLLATVLGPNLSGNAMAVSAVTIGTTTYLFVADFGYGLHVFDVSNPLTPVLVGGWASPPNVFDGWIDHPSDLELDRDATTGNLYAYMTVWRRGLLRIDVTNPASFSLPVVAEHDTPGLPYGIAIRNAYGARGIVLADHQAGLRLYGDYASWIPYGSGCAGSTGVPALQVVSAPALGSTLTLNAQNLGAGIGVMVTGFAQVALPLQPVGLGFGPGCTLLVTLDALDVMLPVGGSATWSLPIPNLPALVGLHLYNQAAELGVISAVSNAGDGKID